MLEGKQFSCMIALDTVSHIACIPSNCSAKKEGEDFLAMRFSSPVKINNKDVTQILGNLSKSPLKMSAAVNGLKELISTSLGHGISVVFDLPRRSLPLSRYFELGDVLRDEHYAQALIMLRTWKSALAPWLAGIPLRTGFVGELRYGLINDLRRGERALPRMIDRMGALALLPGDKLPAE